MSKRKLTLSVQEDLIKYIKVISVKNDSTVSEIFENYIKAIKKSNQAVIKAIDDINNK